MNPIHRALTELRLIDALSDRATPYARLDPRARVLVTLGFVVTVVSFDRYAVAALLPMALFLVVTAAMAQVPWRMVGRGLWLSCPFAVMLGLFNPWLDPLPLLTVAGCSVSGGWVSYASLLIRFGLTVSAALILVAGTGFDAVCAGLWRLGLPTVLTTQLLLLHRYAVVLVEQAAQMNLARVLRCSHGRTAMPLAVYGSLLGHLLLRTMQKSERIYQAMVSRGFDGTLRGVTAWHWRGVDSWFVLLSLCGFGLARSLNVAQVLGQIALKAGL